MPAPLTLYIVRHGEVHNPDGILYGRMPNFYLSANGRDQATSAGQVLAEKTLDAVYASPMERAQETAGMIIEQRNEPLAITVDERINECYTPFDGTSHAELEAINFDLYTGTNASYEQPRDLRRRLQAFIHEIRQKHAHQAVLAVTHGDIVVSAFMLAKEQDENDIGRTRTQANRIHELGLPEIYPATASISTLVFSSDDPAEVPTYHYQRPYDVDDA